MTVPQLKSTTSALDSFTSDLLQALLAPTSTSTSNLRPKAAIIRSFTLILKAHKLDSYFRITLLHQQQQREHYPTAAAGDQLITCNNSLLGWDKTTQAQTQVEQGMHEGGGGEMAAVAWGVRGGVMVPLEFFPAAGLAWWLDFEAPCMREFVREFVETVEECGLEDVLGLRLVQ